MSLATKVMAIVEQRPGVSDRALSKLIFNTPHRSTQINGECHYLQNLGRIARKKIGDEPIGNYPAQTTPQTL